MFSQSSEGGDGGGGSGVVEGLEGDEVHQVALRRCHAVWEEVDECVEELRSLSVRLVHV